MAKQALDVLLAMSKEEFYKATHVYSSDGGDYGYYPSEDSEEARKSYLKYLYQKGYSIVDKDEL